MVSAAARHSARRGLVYYGISTILWYIDICSPASHRLTRAACLVLPDLSRSSPLVLAPQFRASAPTPINYS